jgi:hypothetical protein
MALMMKVRLNMAGGVVLTWTELISMGCGANLLSLGTTNHGTKLLI